MHIGLSGLPNIEEHSPSFFFLVRNRYGEPTATKGRYTTDGSMGLGAAKHVYIDRDMTPEMFYFLCLAEAVSPRVVWALIVAETVAASR